MKESRDPRPALKTRVNKKAGELILSLFPDWKQRNMIASTLFIVVNALKRSGAFTAQELVSLDQYDAEWAKVVALRNKSDTKNAIIDGGEETPIDEDWV